MKLLETVIETLPFILQWIGIIAGSILAPSISIWAIIKLVKWIIRKLSKQA